MIDVVWLAAAAVSLGASLGTDDYRWAVINAIAVAIWLLFVAGDFGAVRSF